MGFWGRYLLLGADFQRQSLCCAEGLCVIVFFESLRLFPKLFHFWQRGW